ncbi:MAG: hypothetical protein M3220_11480 [Chloroflexota bacterium]|nr:hypothetical protein [Chloroflexota bacterium]
MLHPQLPVPNLDSLPRYRITARLEPPSLSGQMQLTLPNGGDETLEDVVLRLYGNAETIYTGSQMWAGNVSVDGQATGTQEEVEGTALRIFLPEPLPPGEAATLSLDFQTIVATENFRGYGIQQMAGGIGVFGSPFPLLALRENDKWRVSAVPVVGDGVSSPVGLWDIFLELPADVTLVSTGEIVPTVEGTVHVVSGPARDVVLTTLPAGAAAIETQVAGVRLRYWPAPYVEMAGSQLPASEAATIAAEAVEAFAAEFGPPPYTELDVVEAQVPIGGYEYPGLVLFDGEERARASRNALEFLIPHEIAHQWFYALLGNDVTREPWIDEGLATYASLRYLAHRHGAEAALARRAAWEAEYANVLAREPVGVNGVVYEYTNWIEYRGPTYYASALLFDDLRQRLGDAPFQEAIRRLLTRFAFREATTQDVQAVFNEVATEEGVELDAFWSYWLR